MPESSSKTPKMNIRMADRLKVLELRTILAYEAEMRGLSIGQTCAELVSEGADFDSYPQEMLDLLADIQEQSKRRAVERLIGDPSTN